MSLTFKTKNDLNNWEKAYWYLRLLVNTDRYGGLSKNGSKLIKLHDFLLSGYNFVKASDEPDEVKVKTLMSILEQVILEKVREDSKKYYVSLDLIDELKKYLLTLTDFYVFATVIKNILLPTNDIIKKVPTGEGIEFALTYANALLDSKHEKGLSNLIREWDLITEDLCLNRERELMVSLFNDVRKTFKDNLSETELDVILTATCQEYERRVSQKRKQRAGGDLETATSFILDYFNFKRATGPEHFNAGIEVDNWVKDKKGWYIGISLKRTLRERWKQTYTTEIGLLDRYKIKYIIHLLNNDRDLSDTKIGEMGSYRHLFFIADDSKVLKEYREHVALKNYVFPMSSLIRKLREFSN
ncbi:hypothetical protein ABES25_01415 [Bacillus gobiensis]|uniref:hypothetical protein n=1 Tax=Bacillus gobiensis TaxID=1441095 RepID=UPI003D20E000